RKEQTNGDESRNQRIRAHREAGLQGVARLLSDQIEVVAVNDLTDTRTLAHLLTYDSNYGSFDGDISAGENSITVEGDEMAVLAERDPAKLPWRDLGAEIVIESTGVFTDAAKAKAHIDGGAKKVILTAPSKG